MRKEVEQALNNIDLAYTELIEIANDIFNEITGDVDNLISTASDDSANYSNELLRTFMLKLSLKSYSFSEIKEKSAFKATLGETLKKEMYAKNFNESSGTVAIRENTAIINSSAEILAQEIYSLVANMFKIKLDEIHRVVNTLQTILMTRMQEAKLTQVDTM